MQYFALMRFTAFSSFKCLKNWCLIPVFKIGITWLSVGEGGGGNRSRDTCSYPSFRAAGREGGRERRKERVTEQNSLLPVKYKVLIN